MLGRKVLSDKYVTKLYTIFKQKKWKIQIIQSLIDFVVG